MRGEGGGAAAGVGEFHKMIKTQCNWGSSCSIKRKNAADEHDHLEPFEKNCAQSKTEQIEAIFSMMNVILHRI